MSFADRKRPLWLSWLAAGIFLAVFLVIRSPYHINYPLFEDEGIFLLDSRDFWQLYENSIYMKPPLGALVHYVAGLFQTPFLVLHILTSLAILLSTVFLYRILMAWVPNRDLVFVGCLAFIYCTAMQVDGAGHSSLEHYQNVLLLAAFWFYFVREKPYWGGVFFTLAALILHNIVVAIPTLMNFKRSECKPMLLQHVVTFFPLMALLSTMFLYRITQLNFLNRRLLKVNASTLLTSALIVLLFSSLTTAYENELRYINGHGMLTKYTFSPGLAHGHLNQQTLDRIMAVLSANANKTAYVYPVMVPHVYPRSGARAMPRLAANDHVWLFTKNPKLFHRLIDAIYTSKPDVLIRTNASALDKPLAPLLSKEYRCIQQDFWLCVRKTSSWTRPTSD